MVGQQGRGSIIKKKSSVSFSRNVDATQQEEMCSMLNVRSIKDLGNYLGIPSFIGRAKKKALEFLKDRIWHIFHKWTSKKLSLAGKEVLLKTVAQACQITPCQYSSYH